MFTGIIEEIGTIQRITAVQLSMQIAIKCSLIQEDMKIGDSIAVNGICLTVTRFDNHSFEADVMPETLRSTGLGDLRAGSRVNLERAMPANGRFGGHILSGHIDGTGRLIRKTKEVNAIWLEIEAQPSILKYIVLKGSIALDGTSLTVSQLTDRSFAVSLIPHTAEMTILAEKATGSLINIECDVVAKYVEKLTNPSKDQTSEISIGWLQDNGF